MSAHSGTLGKYQIIREIARSNDIVYEAWDPQVNRRVALKELNMPGGASDKQREDRIRRFEREARAAGTLAHPNIVTIYEVGVDAGRHYIAMEYLEGENLRQRLDATGMLGQDEAVRILLEVLDGLSYAHEKGIVHRDIKPDNIQLLPDGRVKITDFGIARLTFEPSLTMDGQIFGTPSYMSPEQVHGRDVDARTDVWSVGVVLYEAICGTKPFSGDSVVSISHAILHHEPLDPVGASFAISRVIRTAIDKSPTSRFTNAKAMANALKEAMDDLQPSHTQPTGSTIPPAFDPYATNVQSGAYNPYSVPAPPPQYAPPGASPYGGIYGQSSSPYGQPYGQAQPQYGQIYGTPNAPPPQFPASWVAPPKRPLLSPEASEFLRKTMIVVLIGGAIITILFGIIWGLTEATNREMVDRRQSVSGSMREGMADDRWSRVDEYLRRAAMSGESYTRLDNFRLAKAEARGLLELSLGTTEEAKSRARYATILIRFGSQLQGIGRFKDARAEFQEAMDVAPDGSDEQRRAREAGDGVPL
ncbi:MAG: protein kinase [Fimbriimonadales bacterium]|nr:protein kinase [Fimbriimonadales bacterium]